MKLIYEGPGQVLRWAGKEIPAGKEFEATGAAAESLLANTNINVVKASERKEGS